MLNFGGVYNFPKKRTLHIYMTIAGKSTNEWFVDVFPVEKGGPFSNVMLVGSIFQSAMLGDPGGYQELILPVFTE